MKRFFILANTVCILLMTLFTTAVLSQPVFSLPSDMEIPVKSGEWLYFDRGDSAFICGYLGKEEHITIPSEIDGKAVTELCFNGYAGDGYFSGQYKSSCFFGEFSGNAIHDWVDPAPETTRITIPDSVKRIGGYTFYNCLTLTEIDMPDSIASIGEYAFYNCSGLQKADIPESVERIGGGAFGITQISSFTIPEGVGYIGEKAFYKTPVSEIAIPDSVEYIGESALADCSKLKSVRLSANLKEIPSYLFKNCSSLESLDIPEAVRTIGTGAFERCLKLTSAKLPAGITELPVNLFYGCGSLVSVEIPEGVQTIGKDAFAGCKSLRELHLPKSLRSAAGILSGNQSLETISLGFDKDMAEAVMGYDVKVYLALWEYEADRIKAKIVYGEKASAAEPEPEPVSAEKTQAEKTRDLLKITAAIFTSLFLITLCMLIIQKAAVKPRKAEQGSNLLTKYSSDAVICRHCGTSGGKEASYCTNCGKKLTSKMSKKQTESDNKY